MNGQSFPGTGGGPRRPLFVVLVAILLLSSAVVGAGGVLAQSPVVDSASHSEQPNEKPANVGPASVNANYQTSDGKKATVSSATLPDGGYVGVYRYSGDGNSLELIGATDHLGAGTHEDITIGLLDVPGKHFSTSSLDSTTFLVTRIHQDTNDNKQFDYSTSSGSEDGFYTNESDQPVSDSGYLKVTGSDSKSVDSGSSEDGDSSISSNTGTASASANTGSSSDTSTSNDSLESRVANAGQHSGQSTTEGATSSDTGGSSESKGSGANSDVSNTFRVQSLGEKRTHYTLSVNGEIEIGSRFDETDAKIPDTLNGSSVNGSVAKRGMDNLTFSGEIKTLTISNGNANVSVNGGQVDAEDYLDKASESDSGPSESASTSTSGSTDTATSTDTSSESDSNDEGTATTNATQQIAADVEKEGDTGAGGSVTFEDQKTDGKSVTIDSATLPSQGFVVLHGPSYTSAGVLKGSVVAASDSLSAGEHKNITLTPGQNVPNARYNSSWLEGSGNYTAMLYRDTNSNGEYEYLSDSGTDIPFVLGSGDNERLLSDNANVTIAGSRADPDAESSQEYANISFPDQDSSGATVTVTSTYLPDGGFVAIHNESYLPPENDSIGSVIGVSRYLEPGNHTNVEVQLYSGVPGANYSQSSLDSSMTLTASAAQDVNKNLTYNYLTSRGEYDVGYLDEGGAVVDDQADVTLADSNSAFTTSDLNESGSGSEIGSSAEETVGQFGNETITPTPSGNQSVVSDLNGSDNGSVNPNKSVEIDQRQVATPTPTNESADSEQSGGIAGTIFTGISITAAILVVVVLGVAYIVISRR